MFRRHPSSARSVALTRTGTMSLTNLAVRVSEPAAEGEHLRLEIVDGFSGTDAASTMR